MVPEFRRRRRDCHGGIRGGSVMAPLPTMTVDPPDWMVTGRTKTVDQFVEHVRYFVRHFGRGYRQPETAGEIEAMFSNFPDRAPRLSPDQLREMGLSPFLRSGV